MNKNRTLGNTSISLCPIGYGAMHLSIDRDKRPSESDSVTLLRRIVEELGINFIDTADAYCADNSETGHNERLIGLALKELPKGLVTVATKGGSVRPDGRWERNGRPEHLRAACDASLRALGVEAIDLYQLHAPDPNVPIQESVGALADLQRHGKILHIGVSNVSLDQLQRSEHEATIVSVQNQFSVINRRDEYALLEYCASKPISYIPWNPVGGRGRAPELGGESDALAEIASARDVAPHAIALAWLLRQSPAMLPIPGSRKFEHVAENMKALEIELTADELERLSE